MNRNNKLIDFNNWCSSHFKVSEWKYKGDVLRRNMVTFDFWDFTGSLCYYKSVYSCFHCVRIRFTLLYLILILVNFTGPLSLFFSMFLSLSLSLPLCLSVCLCLSLSLSLSLSLFFLPLFSPSFSLPSLFLHSPFNTMYCCFLTGFSEIIAWLSDISHSLRRGFLGLHSS